MKINRKIMPSPGFQFSHLALLLLVIICTCAFTNAKSETNAHSPSDNELSYDNAIKLIINNTDADFKNGLLILENLAQSGDTLSIDRLAKFYRYGYPMIDRPQRIKKNVVLYYAYSLISSSLGSETAKSALSQEEWWRHAITDQQISDAKTLAQNWRIGLPLPHEANYQMNKSVIYLINNQTIYFNGPVYRGSYEDFMKVINKNVRTIILNSPGGSIYDGVKIGLVVQKLKLTAIVDGECLSACANYLFIGASKRIINDNGIVCFHGGNVKVSDIADRYKIVSEDDEKTKKEKIKMMKKYIPVNKNIQKMEYDLLDFYGIPHDLLAFKFISTLPKILENVDISNETVMSCPDKTNLDLLNVNTDKMWYPDDSDGSKLLKIGKSYHYDLTAVPGMLIQSLEDRTRHGRK